jgi:diadenosine tetraphosphate (Ap4A) HIT family hydrolase
MTEHGCPFCARIRENDVTEADELVVAFPDGFPVSLGHMLVVPRRHVLGLRDLTSREQAALMELAQRVETRLDGELQPDGYNLGINDGAAAGQTVDHVHLHVIPRYAGDLPDPRGGIRWLFPDKADYWSSRG